MQRTSLNEFLDRLPDLEEGKKAVSVLSGGLDSTTLTYLLVKKYGHENVIAVTFNLGQKLDIEIEKAKITCSKLNIPHKILDIGFLGKEVASVCSLARDGLDVPHITDTLGDPQCSTYWPYRNLTLLSIALGVSEANNAAYIFYGAQGNDAYQYWDTVPEFLIRLNSVSDLNRRHGIQIIAPFIPFDKSDEILWGIEIGVDYNDSWTCYNGADKDGKPCKFCPGCADRIAHFMKAGIKDPCEYQGEPINWEAGFKHYRGE